MKTLPVGHANAIEATDLETDPEWDAPTQDEVENLFEEDSEIHNDSLSTLTVSTELWKQSSPTTENWQPTDPGFKRIINESDLDIEDNVDFETVIDEQPPTNCPFIEYEAV